MSKKKKHKIEGYIGVFREKLDKLCKNIEKARKNGEIDKEHTKRIIKEAEDLKRVLKEFED